MTVDFKAESGRSIVLEYDSGTLDFRKLKLYDHDHLVEEIIVHELRKDYAVALQRYAIVFNEFFEEKFGG